MLCFFVNTNAAVSCTVNKHSFLTNTDTSVSSAIQAQLAYHQQGLYYPQSVDRFYKQNGYKLAWIAPDTVKTHASEAMLLLDCVLQFGLKYADYHPKELTYEKLNLLTQKSDKQSNSEKAGFDMMLTDALITYINHLHYGKLNPVFPAAKIDSGDINGFDASTILTNALEQKNFDFMSVVLSVQPQSAAYKKLQYYLYLYPGLYTGDCYEIPDSTVRKIAVNLERMRWISSDEKTYIEINIPSYSLKFQQPDTLYRFKVIVGKPGTPTPTLQSAISYFTTAPEWKVPQSIFRKEILPRALKDIDYLENNHIAIYDADGNYIEATRNKLLKVKENVEKYHARQSSGCGNSLGLIVFRFPNIYDIYLHDTPEQMLFKKQARAYSHGCIRVEHAEKLADLLLKNEGANSKITILHKAVTAYQHKRFILKTPVSIKVTYFTCEVEKGILITYPDIYSLDKSLETALYNIEQP